MESTVQYMFTVEHSIVPHDLYNTLKYCTVRQSTVLFIYCTILYKFSELEQNTMTKRRLKEFLNETSQKTWNKYFNEYQDSLFNQSMHED